jgi:hypothetical protein
MKLTIEQIAQIEETLVLNGVKYDDIKLEVTDHIASEIEVIINEDGFLFETAFKEVFEKWKPQLRPSSSFWVGIIYSAPKIVLDKWVSITKQQQLKSLFIAIIPALIFTIFLKSNVEKYNYSIFASFLKTISLVTSLLIAIAKIMIWKSKIKTSFGFIFNKSTPVYMSFLLFYGLGVLPMKFTIWDFGTRLFFVLMLSFLVLNSIFNLQLAYKHFQMEKKLSIS